MPSQGRNARALVLGTLTRLAHEKLISKETFAFLEALEGQGKLHSIEAALLRRVRHEVERAKRLPTEFVEESRRLISLADAAWQEARKQNDFSLFAPYLEKNFEIAMRRAEYWGYDDHPYTALMHDFEPGLRTSEVRELFAKLRERIRPLVRSIQDRMASQGEGDMSFLQLEYDEALQEQFVHTLASGIGYDFERGRLDRSAHPFSVTFGRDDSRITTRYAKNSLIALFATLHETGHALYEQGVDETLERTPLSGGASYGTHESQSRLFEHLIGRSLSFWKYWYPKLQASFPQQLGQVSLEQFYRGINRVTPSLIRVEADAVTYDLHIMLRTELEIAILEGKIKVSELPEAWNARIKEDLGLDVPNHAQGVLQDSHWPRSGIGYFPSYTIGNILSVQFLRAAEHELGPQDAAIERGEYGPLLGWLREHIHRWGRCLLPTELVTQVTGGPIQAEPYLEHLERRFGDLYGLQEYQSAANEG